MIKAVILDLNGIFIKSPRLSTRFEKDFNIPTSEFLPKLSEIMGKVRMPGAGKAFQYWQPILEKWGINLSEQEFWNYWFKAETPSQDIIDLARSLKARRIKIFILSNNFSERADFYDHYSWMHGVVDRSYFSWQTGFVKPDVRAWKLLLKENNLKGEECLFFDDQQMNVKVAESLNIRSFLFTSPEELKREVEECFVFDQKGG